MRRALLPLLVVPSACALITSFEGFDEPKAIGDAGDDVIDAGSSAPCHHRRWPPPPASGGGGDIGEVLSAVRALSLVTEAPEPPGFDLDDLCTCAEPVACVGAQPNKPCDPVDSGTDNAANALFSLFASISGTALDEDGLRAGLQLGRFGVIFRVSGWNGEPDDPEVQVAVFNAVAVNPGTDAGARFDGKDRWVLDDESLVGGRLPLFPATSAYVTGGELVATFTRLLVKARIPTVNERWLLIPVEMRDVHVQARVSRDGAGVVLKDGVIGGRLPTAGLLSLAATAGACPGTEGYRSLKSLLCEARDLPLDPGKDGRDAPCEAVSVGMRFDAVVASVVDDAGAVVEYLPCADAGPADDCE